MKVVDVIKRLNEIGFDENTELTFSCVDGDTGAWYELNPDCNNGAQDPFSYGEELTGEPYNNDIIDFCLNVDECKDYLREKCAKNISDLASDLMNVIVKYE